MADMIMLLDTLMALLILAFTGTNVSIASGASDNPYGHAKCGPHAARLIGEDGKLSFDRETFVQAARSVLIEVLSLRRNRSDSGLIARVAGDAIGADQFLPNMATEDLLSCLSRAALEATAETAGVPGRIKVKDTRVALFEHFAEGKLVHPAALLAPLTEEMRSWLDATSASIAVWRMPAGILIRSKISFPVVTSWTIPPPGKRPTRVSARPPNSARQQDLNRCRWLMPAAFLFPAIIQRS
jgi:hypothetical protein